MRSSREMVYQNKNVVSENQMCRNKNDEIIDTVIEFIVKENNLSNSILSILSKILYKLNNTGTIKAKNIGIKQLK